MNIRVLFEIMYSTDSNSVIINSSYVSLYKLKQTILGADRKTNYDKKIPYYLVDIRKRFHLHSFIYLKEEFLSIFSLLILYQIVPTLILITLSWQSY